MAREFTASNDMLSSCTTLANTAETPGPFSLGAVMIRLTGTLTCANPEDAHLVGRLLPDHILQSRASPGCLSFTVLPMEDGLTWALDETFADRAACQAHQARAAGSAWGRETAHIPREYRIFDAAEVPGPGEGSARQ